MSAPTPPNPAIAPEAPAPQGSLRRNTFYNIAGSIVPIFVSLVTVPLYLHDIGIARYGILAIVWLVLGYFSVFDLGLARATTNQVAKLRHAPLSERSQLFWTATLLNMGFGVIGGLCVYGVGGVVFGYFIKATPALHNEVLSTLPWLAASIPLATMSGVFTGTLAGCERFLLVNTLQVFGTMLFQIVPLVVAIMHGPTLRWIIPAAILTRLVTSVPLAVAAGLVLPAGRPRWPTRLWARKLLGYGAWVSVTNFIGPILEALDRLLIGVILGATAVAYYSVPFNLANRLRILPGALVGVLFPRFSQQNDAASRALATESVRVLAAVVTPVSVAGILGLGPFIDVWISPAFSHVATPVGQIILIGVWINSLAHVPFAWLQAQGRPDLVAKFHALELIPFLGVLWAGLHAFGLPGAALAWTLRVAMDTVLLFWASGEGLRSLRPLWPGALAIILAWLLAQPGFMVIWLRVGFDVLLFMISGFWAHRRAPELWRWV
ncbi:MAG TPA: flippase [Acidiferrobacter sp.]|nr:flippase [Acidiferrobacter sp.]